MDQYKHLGARPKTTVRRRDSRPRSESPGSEWEKTISFITSTPTMTRRHSETQPLSLFMSMGASNVPVRQSSEWEKTISFITSTPTVTRRHSETQPRSIFMSMGASNVPVRQSSEWEKTISFITSTPTMTRRHSETQPRGLFMSMGASNAPVRQVTEEEFAREMSLKYSNDQLDSDEEVEKEMKLKCSKMTSESVSSNLLRENSSARSRWFSLSFPSLVLAAKTSGRQLQWVRYYTKYIMSTSHPDVSSDDH